MPPTSLLEGLSGAAGFGNHPAVGAGQGKAHTDIDLGQAHHLVIAGAAGNDAPQDEIGGHLLEALRAASMSLFR